MRSCDVRVVQRREDFGLPLEPGETVWIGREEIRQNFQRDIAVELRVAGLVDLTHATFTDLGGDFIDAEAGAWVEGHG